MSFLSIITRYFNEPYLDEFVEYYLHEGVDKIYILYDVHSTMSISSHVKSNPKVEIFKSENFDIHELIDVNDIYTKIRHLSKWFMFIDIDEFITTKKNGNITIRRELMTTFKDVDCIKIPWVMMACGSIKRDPISLLQNLCYRWNHDLRHPHPNNWHKGRCRYEKIEVKCIFKSEKFDHITWHFPVNTKNSKYYHKINNPTKTMPYWGVCDKYKKDFINLPEFIFVDGVYSMRAEVNSSYDNLREDDINNAYLLCYHYRIISQESCIRKFTNNKIDRYKGDYNNLLLCDYPEIKDESLRNKSIKKFGIKQNPSILVANNIKINKCKSQIESIFRIVSIIQSNMMELTTFSQESNFDINIEDKINTDFENENKNLEPPFIKIFEDILTKQRSLSSFIKKKMAKRNTYLTIITEKEQGHEDNIDSRPLNEISDCGHSFKPYGWYDALNQGRGNVDYGRWVGDESDPFWSVALNGVFNQLSSRGAFEQPEISVLSKVSDRRKNI